MVTIFRNSLHGSRKVLQLDRLDTMETKTASRRGLSDVRQLCERCGPARILARVPNKECQKNVTWKKRARQRHQRVQLTGTKFFQLSHLVTRSALSWHRAWWSSAQGWPSAGASLGEPALRFANLVPSRLWWFSSLKIVAYRC